MARYDVAGLVILLRGGEVVAMTAHLAEIRTISGALQRHRRRAYPPALPRPAEAVLMWEVS